MPYSFSIPKMRRFAGGVHSERPLLRGALRLRVGGGVAHRGRRAVGAVVGRRCVVRRVVGAEQPLEQLAGDAAERAPRAVAVEHRHLELGRGELAGGATGGVGAEQAHGQQQRLGQVQALAPLLLQAGLDLLRSPAHGDEPVLVGHRAVVGEPVDLVGLGGRADLGDDDLDLVGLGLLGEHRAQGLRVGVGQAARGDVGPVVGVAAQVGVAHAGHPQVLELVVLAHRREGDPVVDLGDLVQRPAGVLTDERDAVVVGEHHDGPAAGDSLAREVGPVLHQLLGRDVERHPGGHRAPPGLSTRAAMMASTTGAISASGTKRDPSPSTTPIVGQMRRPTSGPPVAESSSAAS